MASGRLSCQDVGKAIALTSALAIASILVAASPSQAFEAFDGRFQAHGYFESQFRALNEDYGEDWDVSQWYMIFNLELEMDLVQDTVGPIDLMSAFVRAEVRYDCIYSSGCGMFRSMNAYGDRSKSLPRRLLDQDRVRHSGRIRIENDPELPDKYRNFIPGRGTNTDPLQPLNDPTFSIFANGAGGDGVTPREAQQDPQNGGCVGSDYGNGNLCPFFAGSDNASPVFRGQKDDPWLQLAGDGGYLDLRTAEFGGPWLPKNKFVTNGANRATPNPWDGRVGSYSAQASGYNAFLIARNADTNLPPLFDPNTGAPTPALAQAVVDATTAGQAATGRGALPYRPVPIASAQGDQDPAHGQAFQNPGDPRGLFLPSQPLADLLNKGNIKGIEGDYNLSENQRAWNRGASQKDEKELKEAYLDIEMFDNRLWIRAGKQTIVWGKTELFRTTDQFNPTDNSLASLPSLEESRIPLWSVRGVWSFYEVGPIDDVRLELAFNFDDYQQSDIGACGEPYAPNVTCQLTFGAFAHSVFGVGLAGVEDPPDPWQSLEGWEVGARLEWRYDRFSFALTDFWGYDDFPTVRQFSTYTRNVDPITARPREIFGTLDTVSNVRVDPLTNEQAAMGLQATQVGTQGSCVDGSEDACLAAADNDPNVTDPDQKEALRKSAVAQQLYAYTCSSSVGFSDLDTAACSLNIFGSTAAISPLASIAQGTAAILAGSTLVNLQTLAPAAGGFIFPFVRLDVNSGDLVNLNTNGSTTPCTSPNNGSACGGQGLGLIGLFGTTRDAAGNIRIAQTLGGTLSPQQEALMGCGPLWGTQCDDDGIDLLTAEGSALYQSWPGVEGTVRERNIQLPWYTNQKVTSPVSGLEVFAAQPGTRNWYFDTTREHPVGPVCTTANFGGATFRDSSDELENDTPNGNQVVLPGCRRKWKRDPDDPDFQGAAQILALNLYGRDLECARERASTGSVSGGCITPQGELGDFTGPRVDPRSWDEVADGNPDPLSLQLINFGFTLGDRQVSITPPRALPNDGLVQAPDFFYSSPTFANGTQLEQLYSSQAANPVAGLAFDFCDPSGYPSDIIAEYGGAQFVPCGRGGHPMTGQPFSSEMAALSWNFMALLVQLDGQAEYDEMVADCASGNAPDPAFCALSPYEQAREVFLLRDDGCTFRNPGLCDTFRTLQGSIGLQRNIRRAGGNGVHGRRTFAWQSGGEAILTYNKRNVLGFSVDFAEDFSKSSFNFEFTWIEGVEVSNNLQYDGLSSTDEFNLSMSVDRPTFINFLNANRTFFFNWQFFARYRSDWEKGYNDEGPWNFVTTFAVATAYFQDRLSSSLTTVYDVRTQSGALLPSMGYRFTQNFSAAVGLAFFYGKPDQTDEPIAGLAPAGNRSDRALGDLYKVDRGGGLSVVQDRDEVWARIRYTF